MSVQPKDATILVVEDNFQNFVLITRLLAYLGVKKCEWKASGWQVLEFAESLPNIDLILMDIFLPEEDGYQILERLRAHPRFKSTLVVAVTADASPENLERARSAGASPGNNRRNRAIYNRRSRCNRRAAAQARSVGAERT